MQDNQTTVRVLASPAAMPPHDNPYPGLLNSALENAGNVEVTQYTPRRLLTQKWDIVHIHWPELCVKRESRLSFSVSAVMVLAGVWMARKRGAALVWTAHNPKPWDGGHPRISGWYWRRFVKLVDGMLSLTQAGTDQLHETYDVTGDVPIALVRHGHYRDAYARPSANQQQCREELDLPSDVTILLCLGQVRPNKGIDGLVARLRQSDNARLHLVVAGTFYDPALAERIERAAASDPRIHLRFGAVAPEDIGKWMTAADIAVVPYCIINSGAAVLPPSLNRPLIMPTSPSAVELRGIVGDDWIRLYGKDGSGVIEAADAVIASPPSGSPDLSALEWPLLARQTLVLYRAAIANRGHHTVDITDITDITETPDHPKHSVTSR